MGLTNKSTGAGALRDIFNVQIKSSSDIVVALAGNPNTGKSTVFNSLTGLNQHTGNWPGKTVVNAQGRYNYNGNKYILVDLPGTYSLIANSVEEEVARDFICFGAPHTTVVVADATCLERNLNLVLQIIEINPHVVLAVNLMDEAKRKKMIIDLDKLSGLLSIPVVGTSARNGEGLNELMEAIHQRVINNDKPKITNKSLVNYHPAIEEAISSLEPLIRDIIQEKVNSRWVALRLLEGNNKILESLNKYLNLNISEYNYLMEELSNVLNILTNKGFDREALQDEIVCCLVGKSEAIAGEVVKIENKSHNNFDRKVDNILTSKIFGIPIMIALLGVIFWLTIAGSNYPSELLASFFFRIEDSLSALSLWVYMPAWIHDILVLGIYRTLSWVVSVMLPPMAIFFPLFTLLEDLGYLPRVAFNLDNFFKKACAHGKQSLTMCMGFGCNAAGVIACRIIDSPRERLIAIITNNFVPCNGRFPILIAMSAIFIGGIAAGKSQSAIGALTVMLIVLLGIIATLFISKILSKTILKGMPSSFTLELPPYRKPQVGRIIVRSLLDRTLFVLGRAVIVAAPAGVVIWIMANINVGGLSILSHCAGFLDPFAQLIGLDGYILMAFILGLPANEIIIPIIIMSYMSTGSMLELDSMLALKELLISNGWTWLTAVSVMLFSLMHFPCGTTLLTIKKETQSIKWTIISFLVPTIAGIIVCFIFTQIVRLLGLV